MHTNSLSKHLQLEDVNLHYLDYGGAGLQRHRFLQGAS